MTRAETKDPRIAHTLNTLRTTALKLVQENPTRAVSISELCKQADISRVTFYKHFQSVDDVVADLVVDRLDQMGADIESQLGEGASGLEIIQELSRRFMLLAREHITQGKLAWYAPVARRAYADWSTAWVSQRRFGRPYEQLSDSEKTLVSFLVGGTSAVLFYHAASGREELPEDAIKVMLNLFMQLDDVSKP